MKEWTIENWKQQQEQNGLVAFYLYTPMCGTCAVASKMMDVIENLLPDLPLGKANINFLENLAMDYQIESVPCLLISENGNVEKLYAFQSVPFLYDKLKKVVD
ncbi:thioredoxin family protein [Ureibacillus chungkukjangi]|uniref:thioredoxin family protein n=1 Tax=Ureibacillus chungkukjangi TaxID=1202712 RepID=UPI00203F5E38|nr:thioredoxin family protein [Ureibacillus chungkukjangi]MCM3388135.1 thioredoxin family protein [Ureibacillus chungkukjangi]